MSKKLSDKNVAAIKRALPILARLGMEVPDDIKERLRRGEAIKIRRDDVKRLEKKLTEHGRVVVVASRDTFSIFTVEGYKNRGVSGSNTIAHARAVQAENRGKNTTVAKKADKPKRVHWTQKLTAEQRKDLARRMNTGKVARSVKPSIPPYGSTVAKPDPAVTAH